MKKQDIAQKVSEKTGYEWHACKDIITATIEAIGESLAEGEEITLRGLGTLSVKERKLTPNLRRKSGELAIKEKTTRRVPKIAWAMTLRSKIANNV